MTLQYSLPYPLSLQKPLDSVLQNIGWDINAFNPKQHFLVSKEACFLGVIAYTMGISSLQIWMKNRPAYKLNSLFVIHNIILVIVSALLLHQFVEVLAPMIYQHGWRYAFCHPEAFHPQLYWLYYVNYLVKWWELLDTVFLVLKKKTLGFLHPYHHAATMVLCFVELEGRVTMQWVVITLNLFVHVIMYYYYARTAISSKPVWWKKHLTTLQIVQFVIDLAVCYANAYTHFAFTYFPKWTNWGDCYTTDGAALFGCALLSSYLVLFIDFFIRTYKRVGKRKMNGSVNGIVNGQVNGVVKMNGVPNGIHNGVPNGNILAPPEEDEAPLTPRRSARRRNPVKYEF